MTFDGVIVVDYERMAIILDYNNVFWWCHWSRLWEDGHYPVIAAPPPSRLNNSLSLQLSGLEAATNDFPLLPFNLLKLLLLLLLLLQHHISFCKFVQSRQVKGQLIRDQINREESFFPAGTNTIGKNLLYCSIFKNKTTVGLICITYYVNLIVDLVLCL